MRTRYYIYIEASGDEDHELVKHSYYDKLEDAQKELIKITKLYARIEKHTEEYTPPPIGRKYKDESYGWRTEDTEVIEEN